MNPTGIRENLNLTLFFLVIVVFGVLEATGQIVERSVGHYLKWENSKRSQLGRIWERDRESLAAQKKIESLLSSLNLQEQSADSIETFKELFERLTPSFPQLVSREKFLQLYYDFPGQWASNVISSFDLIEIDAQNNWQRVLLTRFGPWITISFIDSQNFPIREIFLSTEELKEIQFTRTMRRGRLEEVGVQPNMVFELIDFLKIFKTLDPGTQKALFPDPQWFLGKNYHITRVGILPHGTELEEKDPPLFAIEYETDIFKNVLLIPVQKEIANNLLSEIEGPVMDATKVEETLLGGF